MIKAEIDNWSSECSPCADRKSSCEINKHKQAKPAHTHTATTDATLKSVDRQKGIKKACAVNFTSIFDF